jgi:hypothetical protein
MGISATGALGASGALVDEFRQDVEEFVVLLFGNLCSRVKTSLWMLLDIMCSLDAGHSVFSQNISKSMVYHFLTLE